MGSHVKIGGDSLWPNMDVIVAKEPSESHMYQWHLLEAIMLRMKEECQRMNATLIVVGIPYLPQVYDEVWDCTFGSDPKMSRTAGIDRFASWCKSNNLSYIDTCEALRVKSQELKRWLHYPIDKHPTPEGHEVIARTVLESGLIRPR